MYNSYNYNKRSLFISNDNYKLPDYNWLKKTELVNSFNNELVSAFKNNLTMYSPEQDLKLFNNLDLDSISTEKVNFDKINAITLENYNKNDDIYNNTKSVLSSVIDLVNKSTNDTVDNLKNMFNIDLSSLKIYSGLLVLFLLLNRI